jgi:Spy/CpxP family protein refolding chaperone
MRKTILIILAAALLIGSLSAGVMAMGRGQGFNGGQTGAGFGCYNNALNLTADQQQKILAIQQEFQKDTQALRFELQKKNLELRQLWAAKPVNQSAIDAKNKEVTAIQVQMNAKAQAMQEKIKTVLTPEQLTQLNENGSNYGPGMRGKGRRGGGRMGCSF